MANNYNLLKNYLYLTLGVLIASVGINLLAAHDIAFGGISGLSIVISYYTGVSLAALNLYINIPLFALGMRFIGKKFLVRSLYSTVLLSVFLNTTSVVRSCQTDLIVSAIFGGLTLGVGVGIVAKSGGSTGGTDMLALILHQYSHFTIGTYMFLIDGSIILLGASTFGLNKALYAILTVFCISQAVNATLKHFDEIEGKLVSTPFSFRPKF